MVSGGSDFDLAMLGQLRLFELRWNGFVESSGGMNGFDESLGRFNDFKQ
jgi:hypothetical protein